MHTKLLTLRYSRRLGSFDDEVLERLQAGCEIQTVSDHYFEIDGVPHLALVVTYSMAAAAREAGQPARLNRADSGGYKTILREEDGPLFEALREWRSRAAQKQGQARFVLFTNAQLARIARARPESKTALGQIDGVGKSRLEKFGDDVSTSDAFSCDWHTWSTASRTRPTSTSRASSTRSAGCSEAGSAQGRPHMRRARRLFERAMSFTQLCKAARRAARGKRDREEVARFLCDLEPGVLQLERDLGEGTWRPCGARSSCRGVMSVP